LLLQLLTKK
jgi:hypothetical protein